MTSTSGDATPPSPKTEKLMEEVKFVEASGKRTTETVGVYVEK